ncbi:hypothetical protein [Streptomyces sclerotialus]|uniref:hypothetical protein n=1 Tax=Streptomyces sclerotialus TaxID=1957 RepID=UPI0004CBB4D3
MLRKPGLVVTSAVCGALVLGAAGPAAAAATERTAAPPDVAAPVPDTDAPASDKASGGLLGAVSDVLHVVGDALTKDDKKSDAETKAEAQAIADELARLQGRDLMSTPESLESPESLEYPADQSGLTGTDAPTDIYAEAAPYAPTDHADADNRNPELPGNRAPAPETSQEQAVGTLHAKLLRLVAALDSKDREDLMTATEETVFATTNLAKTILSSAQDPWTRPSGTSGMPQQSPYAQPPAFQEPGAETPDVDY